MNPLRLEVYRSPTGRQPRRWRARTANGRIVATSHEGFRTRRGAVRAARTMFERAARGGTTLHSP